MRFLTWLMLVFTLCTAPLVRGQDPATGPTTIATTQPQDPRLPAPRAGNKRFFDLHEQFLKRASEGPIDLLFLGDSITERWNPTGKAVWDRNYASMNVANFGISGDRTQYVLWRIANGELANVHPKVTVVMIGTNNLASGPADQIAEAVTTIVNQTKDQTGAKVLLLAIFPRNHRLDTPQTMEKVHQINDTLAKLDNGSSIRYLDIGKAFLGPDGKVPADVMKDGLHPTEHGYELWADAMRPLLSEMMK